MEYHQNRPRDELIALNCLSDAELLERLIPEEERHSPQANIERAKSILYQCVSRARKKLADAYNSHKHTADFSMDFALYLIPILIADSTIPVQIIPALVILIMRHAAELLSKP